MLVMLGDAEAHECRPKCRIGAAMGKTRIVSSPHRYRHARDIDALIERLCGEFPELDKATLADAVAGSSLVLPLVPNRHSPDALRHVPAPARFRA